MIGRIRRNDCPAADRFLIDFIIAVSCLTCRFASGGPPGGRTFKKVRSKLLFSRLFRVDRALYIFFKGDVL